MLVTLITPTGNRPEAFALCEKYVARQTYKGDLQWIVVDDYPKEPTKVTMGQELVKGPLNWKLGFNTQRYNFAVAIPLVKGDYVFILEDDDRYSADYLTTMLGFLEHAQLVGESHATYYSLRTRGYREMGNDKHASLCQTAFTRSYLPVFEQAVHSGNTYIDLALWGNAREKAHSRILFNGMRLVTGIKGVGSGRAGIGFGHQASTEFTLDSAAYHKLKELIGEEDAEPYIAMMKGAKKK